MYERQIHGRIEKLVAEEHELWEREGAERKATRTVPGLMRSS